MPSSSSASLCAFSAASRLPNRQSAEMQAETVSNTVASSSSAGSRWPEFCTLARPFLTSSNHELKATKARSNSATARCTVNRCLRTAVEWYVLAAAPYRPSSVEWHSESLPPAPKSHAFHPLPFRISQFCIIILTNPSTSARCSSARGNVVSPYSNP